MADCTPLSPVQLIRLLIEAGINNPSELAGLLTIAMRESGLNPCAHNYNKASNDNSHGLFQINIASRADGFAQDANLAYANRDLQDARVNVATAVEMFRRSGWAPWTVPAAYDTPERRARDADNLRRNASIVASTIAALSGADGAGGGGGFGLPGIGGIPDVSSIISGAQGAIGNIADAIPGVGGAVDTITSIPDFLRKLGGWMFDSRNWWRLAFLAAGVTLFLLGAVIYAKPIVDNSQTAQAAATVAKLA